GFRREAHPACARWNAVAFNRLYGRRRGGGKALLGGATVKRSGSVKEPEVAFAPFSSSQTTTNQQQQNSTSTTTPPDYIIQQANNNMGMANQAIDGWTPAMQ